MKQKRENNLPFREWMQGCLDMMLLLTDLVSLWLSCQREKLWRLSNQWNFE